MRVNTLGSLPVTGTVISRVKNDGGGAHVVSCNVHTIGTARPVSRRERLTCAFGVGLVVITSFVFVFYVIISPNYDK